MSNTANILKMAERIERDESALRAAVPEVPEGVAQTVYAFRYSSCTHEEAMCVVSLHSKHSDAVAALEAHKAERKAEWDDMFNSGDDDPETAELRKEWSEQHPWNAEKGSGSECWDTCAMRVDIGALEAPPQQAPQADPESKCPLGCTVECLAKVHGCGSECPALPWQPSRAPQAAQPVQPSEPAVWNSPEDTDNAQKLVWLRENGVVFLGYYFEQPFREYRDGDGFYVGQQDAEAYWARHEDGEPCEPDGWCQLLPPLAVAQQAGAVLKPEPVAQEHDASKEHPAVNDFMHWLNQRRMQSVSQVFHETVECYRRAIKYGGRPPQSEQVRKPLTIAEVEAILARWDYDLHGDRARFIVRETELAHHIKER